MAYLLAVAALSSGAFGASGDAVTVYKHGEGGFPCIRIPTSLRVPADVTIAAASTTPSPPPPPVLLLFAAARSFTGDSCFPTTALPTPNNYSAHVVKRSVDGGSTWSAMTEMAQKVVGHTSPEGAAFYHTATKTVTTIWQSNLPSNITTGLRLWQSQSTDVGLTWSTPAPMMVPQLVAANVTAGTSARLCERAHTCAHRLQTPESVRWRSLGVIPCVLTCSHC